MNENISKAFDDANAMVVDCNQKICELQSLEEVYKKMAKSGQYSYDPDRPESILKINFFEKLKSIDYSLQIRGIFVLVKEYPTIQSISDGIERYKEMGDYWIKIRDQLD